MGLPAFPFWVDGKYEAIRLLGKGGGGFALLAKKENQIVAVKLLNISSLTAPHRAIQKIEKFKKEFLTLKKLNHPHIGQLYDFGFDKNLQQYYFAGEFIEGEEIRTASELLSAEEIEKLFVQALQALHYLHTFGRAGLRHNDIKAANIMVTQKGGEKFLKLIDFGLTGLAPIQVRGGTASYMAPEQIAVTFPDLSPKKFSPPDERADLYALGVVWYLCLTDVNPFLAAGDTDATLKKHFEAMPPPPSHHRKEVPKYLDTIVMKLLKVNPDDRYGTAAEVLQELIFLSGKPYSLIPATQRRFYFPQGEFVNQEQAWRPLKEKWDQLCRAPHPQPSIVWIVGERGQGKTKILEHFKNYVQAHEGRFETDTLSDEDTPTCLAIDNFGEHHPHFKNVEEQIRRAQQAGRWGESPNARRLFVFTADRIPQKKLFPGVEALTLFLKNFDAETLKELVQKLLPSKNAAPPKVFMEKLKDHTKGNPRFVLLVLQALGEEGLLLDEKGQWHPALMEDIGIDFSKLPIPQDLKEALQEDWLRLSADEREMVMWLACFADGAAAAELLALHPAPESVLETLCSKGIFAYDSHRRFIFENSFLKRTLTEQMGEPQLTRRHEKIAGLFKREGRSQHAVAHHLAYSRDAGVRHWALTTLEKFFTEAGKWEEALQINLKLLSQTKNDSCEVALKILFLLNRLRRFEESLAMNKEWQKKIARGNKKRLPFFLKEEGETRLLQNEMPAARERFEKALRFMERSKNLAAQKTALQNLIARTYLGERRLEKAIEIFKKTRAAGGLANNDLGYCYLLNGQAAQAEGALKEEAAFYQRTGDAKNRMRTFYLLGETMRRLKRDFNQALQYYQRCEKLARDLRDPERLMRAYHGLAATYLDRAQGGDQKQAYPQALKYFEQSLALALRLRRDASELDAQTAAIYLSIGMVQQELGHLEKAKDAYQTIIAVLEPKPKKQKAEWVRLCEAYLALADARVMEKKWKEAQTFLRKAAAITAGAKELKEHTFGIHLTRARISSQQKKWPEARRHFTAAEKLRHQFQIEPTPTSRRYLEELKRKMG